MRKTRVLSALVIASLTGAVATAGGAGAAASGAGSSETTSSVLGIKLGTDGSLLNLRILGDEGFATIDPKVGPSEAFSSLTAVEISSSVVPALNIKVPTTPLESRSPGGSGDVSQPGMDFASVAGNLPVAVASGGVAPSSLSSAVDAVSARTNMLSAVTDLSLTGGLLSVESVESSLGAIAGQASSSGDRFAKVGAINVLDLGATLNGLGLDMADLPIEAVSGILAELGIPVAGIPTNLSLTEFVAQLDAAINAVQAVVDTAAGTVTGTVDSTVGGVLGTLNLPVPTVGSAVAQVQDTIDTLQATLVSTLESAVAQLDGVSLLKLDGAEVGLATKAADTLQASAADIVATIGGVSVGNLALPGVDLTTATDTVNQLVATVNGTLQDTLGSISPDLANVVSVSVLDQVKNVTSANGYNTAVAGITALTASIVPPANLTAILDQVQAAAGIGDVIGQLGGTVPQLSGVMDTLTSTLNQTVGALAGGAQIEVAKVAAASNFAAVAATAPPGGQLPRTGGSALLMMGALFAALAIGAIRMVRTPVAAEVRTK